MKALAAQEAKRLATLERTIAGGLATFQDVGAALAEIRDLRLYRADFGTFEDYCQTKWGFTKRRGNQLIEAHKVAAGMGTMVPSERVARELGKLPPEVRDDALRAASADGPATADRLEHLAKKAFGKSIQEMQAEFRRGEEEARSKAKTRRETPEHTAAGAIAKHIEAARRHLSRCKIELGKLVAGEDAYAALASILAACDHFEAVVRVGA